jgi:tRNA G26 N,N-dimethylase Trm1
MERFETLRREKEVFNPSPEQNRDLQVRVIAQLAVLCLTRES